MTAFLPRPIRDICEGPSAIQWNATGYSEKSFNSIKRHGGTSPFTIPPAECMIKAALRTGTAAAGCFILMRTGASRPISLAIGDTVSIPATLIASGATACFYGLKAAHLAATTNSIKALGITAACVAGGYWALENHDILPLGFGDSIVQNQAKSRAPALVKHFTLDSPKPKQ